jgi:hypothetical protein
MAQPSNIPENPPPRRLTLLLQTADNGAPTEPIGEEEFLRYCENHDDAQRLFAFIIDCMTEHQEENARLHQELENEQATLGENERAAQEEVAALRERIKGKDKALAELVEERDRFRDAFAQEALVARNRGSICNSPAPEVTKKSTEKSTKIPDPPILTDGKEPKFEDWLLRVEDKLAANADHYPTPAMRLAYVKSRCGGRAAEHLVARSRSDAVNKYQDVTDVLEHLKTIFLDVNRVIAAKEKFRRLYMKPTDKFQDFLSEFSYLAQESGLAEPEWKEELYHRIHADMQRLVIRESNDLTLDFKEFATDCTRTANRLEQISLKEQRGKSQTGQTTSAKTNNRETTHTAAKPASIGRTQSTNIAAGVQGRLTTEDRTQLMKAGKCFYCKQEGHVARDCPIKKDTADLKALESSSQSDDKQSESQGKAGP